MPLGTRNQQNAIAHIKKFDFFEDRLNSDSSWLAIFSHVHVAKLVNCDGLFPGQLGKAPTAVTESLPSEDIQEAGPSSAIVEDEDDVTKMQERLQALRS